MRFVSFQPQSQLLCITFNQLDTIRNPLIVVSCNFHWEPAVSYTTLTKCHNWFVEKSFFVTQMFARALSFFFQSSVDSASSHLCTLAEA